MYRLIIVIVLVVLASIMAPIVVSANVSDNSSWRFADGDDCFVPWTTFAAFNEACKVVGEKWQSSNDRQKDFLVNFDQNKRFLPQMSDILSACAGSTDKVNRFLSDNGFTMKLAKSDLATAGILKYDFSWRFEAQKVKIDAKSGSYEGIHLKEGHGARFITAPSGRMIVIIPINDSTTYGSWICASMTPECPKNLPLAIREWEKEKFTEADEYNSVDIPMLNLEREIKLDWMVGASTPGGDRLQQAIQAVSFQMDEFGGRLKSATAMSVSRGLEQTTTYIFDKPFVVWIERPGDKNPDVPLFAAWVGPKDWHNPNK